MRLHLENCIFKAINFNTIVFNIAFKVIVFKVSKFQSFKVSKFQSFKVTKGAHKSAFFVLVIWFGYSAHKL
nr:hypothetical protein BCV35_03730 [Vibrio cyclitrophicus]